jgi:ubiquinone biosynthesis protein
MGRRSAWRSELGATLAVLLERLGITFIKVGQILSARPDLLPREVVDHLSRLQDDLRPVDIDMVLRQIEESAGAPVGALFSAFDERPLSAASVAQVHRASLGDGTVVAVKVRRPDVARKVRLDVVLLSFLAKVAGRLPGMATLPVEGIVHEWCRAVSEQVDLSRERANLKRFRDCLAASAAVIVPRAFDDLCSESMIVMEYLPDLHKLCAEHLPPEVRRTTAELAINAVYELVFEQGLVHADLHPGNIFFLPTARVVLLDLGFVCRLEDAQRRQFRRFFLGLATGDGAGCAEVLETTALGRAAWFDSGWFRSQIEVLVQEHSRRLAGDFEVASFAARLFDIQRRSGLVGATAFTMAIVSFLVLEGVIKQLDRDVDFLGLAIAHMTRASLPQFFCPDRAIAFLSDSGDASCKRI